MLHDKSLRTASDGKANFGGRAIRSRKWMRFEGRSSCIGRTSRRSVSKNYHVVNYAAVSIPSQFQSRCNTVGTIAIATSAVEVCSDMKEHGIDHYPTAGFRLEGGVRTMQCQYISMTDLPLQYSVGFSSSPRLHFHQSSLPRLNPDADEHSI